MEFSRHPAIEDVAHLFPENIFVACDMKIPGIAEPHNMTGGGNIALLLCVQHQ